MGRGRTRQPDAIKALKGNPRKEKLDLSSAEGEVIPPAPEGSDAPTILRREDYPAFLSKKAEREIFRRIIEDFLPRRLARRSDFDAYGRYAVMMALWIRAKRNLGNNSTVYKTTSRHGEMLRRNPAFQDMLDLDKSLARAELQLGLTPLSRQSIVRGLSSLPGGVLGGLFGEDRKSKEDVTVEASPAPADSPLNFLHPPARPN